MNDKEEKEILRGIRLIHSKTPFYIKFLHFVWDIGGFLLVGWLLYIVSGGLL